MIRPLAAALAMLFATSLLIHNSASAAAPADTTERAAATKVRLTLNVNACNGCKIQPGSIQRRGEQLKYWSGPEKTVRDGKVIFHVPRRWTPWMYLEIWPKTASGVYNAQPLVAMRYVGKTPGAHVSKKRAARGKKAWACWAGTNQQNVTMSVQVTRFQATSTNGEKGPYIRAYMSRGKHTVGSAVRTYRGSLGTQDPAVCYF